MRWVMVGLSLLAAAPQDRPLFSTQSDLVVVHATVEDRRGAPVAGLQRENFLVYEDNHPQPIDFFSSTDAPATIGLLIDNSTSMMSKRERVIAAATKFAELSNPDDEVFVLAFNEHVNEAWGPRLLGESDLRELRDTLAMKIAARGQTALYDAIATGLRLLSAGRHARQVLVLVSDGKDTASTRSLDDTLVQLAASKAMIYSVALQDTVDNDGNPRLLRRLSGMTGGEAFVPDKADKVALALEHIARDIRATYTIGFAPANPSRDGSMRKLRVVAKHPDGRPLKVQTRSGYQPAPPASDRSEEGH